MKTKVIICFLLCAFMLAFSEAATASSLNILFDVKVINNFWWRVKEYVNPHMQFEIDATHFFNDRVGIGIVPFKSYSLQQDESDERDLYFYGVYKLNKLTLKSGYIVYTGNGTHERPEQGEFYANAMLSGYISKAITCSTGLTSYFDIAKSGAAYIEGSFAADIGNTEGGLYATLGSVLCYDLGQFVENEFTALQLRAALNLRIAERVYVVPSYRCIIGIHQLFGNTDIWCVNLTFK